MCRVPHDLYRGALGARHAAGLREGLPKSARPETRAGPTPARSRRGARRRARAAADEPEGACGGGTSRATLDAPVPVIRQGSEAIRGSSPGAAITLVQTLPPRRVQTSMQRSAGETSTYWRRLGMRL